MPVTSGLVLLHLAAMAVVATFLISAAVRDLGLTSGGHIGFGHSADQNFIEVAVFLTSPLVLVEAAAALWKSGWLSALGGVAAGATACVHAWFTSFLVGLRFWGDTTPATRADISDAIATGTFIAAAHLGVLVACIGVLAQIRRLVRSHRARVVEHNGSQVESTNLA